jgi:UDP-N-acetylglucosamine--N-acetylmuramyl-(pentapeptide) pyrophosphoryl-undecaprenol N-acetylglucosamine transferase
MNPGQTRPLIAIACGGTGGHLFPGIAVAEELQRRGADVLLLISPKEVDQQAVKSVRGMEVAVLPAVSLGRGQSIAFALGTWKSYRAAKRLFRRRPPQAVLAMGGFTSAPPILAGRACSARTFLHDSNTIPGRANRWLAGVVDQAFVGFPSTAALLRCRRIEHTGTPVRPEFKPAEPGACRVALGLEPQRPTLLIMGGSQGALGVNSLALAALPQLQAALPSLQFFHCAGSQDADRIRGAYEKIGVRAVVHSFFSQMELALGAASVAVSRAGASSLAELAAMRLPAVLIPYPIAADNHQFHNARAFLESGAALMLEQKDGTGEQLATMGLALLLDEERRQSMSTAVARWHTPDAAARIAGHILATGKSA